MSEFESSQEIIDHAALACASKLAKLFGSTEDAISALEADPVAMAQIAIAAFMEDQRKMSIRAHMNRNAFARIVLDKVKA